MNKENEGVTHLAYSDESNYNNPNYAAICLITLKKEDFEKINSDLSEILKSSNIAEFKWKNIGKARERFCAEKIISYVIENRDKLRIDVLIWDVKERKEKYPEKDMVILKKMYYQLYKNVLKNRWPAEAKWFLYPDEHSAMNWNETKEILDNSSIKMKIIRKGGEELNVLLIKDFHVLGIKEVNSHNSTLCQVADLFSGMSACSYIEYNLINLSEDQHKLTENNHALSNSEKEKIKVMNNFRRKCREKEFNISFSNGFRTIDPSCPINFWYFKYIDHKTNNQSLKKWF